MREYIGALRTFFANEVVDVDGEFVEVHGARFDSMYRPNEPVADADLHRRRRPAHARAGR